MVSAKISEGAPKISVPSIKAYRVDVAPVIDGKLTDECWQKAEVATDFWKLDGSAQVEQSARAQIAYDDENLYVAFWSLLRNAGSVTRKIKPDDISDSNTVEVFLDPLLDHRRSAGLGDDLSTLFYNYLGAKVFRFAVDARNRQFSELMGKPWWKVPWRSATHIGENFWSVEIEIPFASLCFFEQGPKSVVEPGWGAQWGINFACDGISWVPGFDKSGYPSAFGEVTDLLVNPNPRRWAFLTGVGPRIVGDVPVGFTMVNGTGQTRRVKVKAQFIPYMGKEPEADFKAEKIVQVAGEGAFWSHSSFVIPLKSPGTHLLLLSLLDERDNKVLAHRPLLVEDVQIGSGMWDRSFYMNEREAHLSLNCGLELGDKTVRCELREKGKEDVLQRKQAEWDRNKMARVSFDLSFLPVGDYTVTMTVPGYEDFSFVKLLRKRKMRTGAVQYTDRGLLLRDGKPFFPFGMYYVTLPLLKKVPFAEEYAKAGFNTFCMEWLGADAYARMAKDMKEYRIVPIVSLHTMQDVYAVESDYSRKNLLEGRFPIVRRAVKMISSEVGDNILAWYTRDEPNELMYDLVRGYHEIVQEEDSYHPSLTVMFQPHIFAQYADATDILAPDIYPTFPTGRIAVVGDGMEKAVKVMGGKPVIAVLQTFYPREGNYRMPNRSELRCMTYLSIVRGTTGILYFSYDYNGPMAEKHPETWKALKELAGEIRALAPVLLSLPLYGVSLKKVEGDGVYARLYEHNGSYYVIAVNSENKPAKAVKFSLQFAGPIRVNLEKAEALFENRQVTVQDRTWCDDFDSYGVHIYEIRRRD